MPPVMAPVSKSTGPWPFPSLSRGRGNKMMDPWGPSELPSWFSEPQQEGRPECELHKDRDHTCGIPVPGMATHAPCLWNVPGLPLVASRTSPLYHGPLAPLQPQQEHRSASFPAQVLKRGQGWQSGKAMAVSLFGAASKSDVSASLPLSSAMQRASGASVP